MSARTSSTPSGLLKSTHRLFLPRFCWMKYTLRPSLRKGRARDGSPPLACSTLIISAPSSAMRRVAVGPARYWVKSRTLTPLNIFLFPLCRDVASTATRDCATSLLRPWASQLYTVGESGLPTGTALCPAGRRFIGRERLAIQEGV